ncbi:hypothetical protein Dsin_026025 [Dipteronia sinensis]|uniref:WRKY domain-containing protein n=1 Tax=Dipteronia sinensis TaxID=43782 RepID=A0AAE0DXD9_9ROSI|nr:hypothetical protein Dsin_026025 [Dipteronia sinensis]
MEVDWDLHAVVRGCNNTSTAVSTATTATTSTSFKDDFDSHQSWFSPSSYNNEQQSGHFFSLSDPFETRNAIEELNELYKPFFPKSHPLSPKSIISSNNNKKPISCFSSISSPREQSTTTQLKQQQQQQQPQPKQQSHVVSTGASSNSISANPQATRSKRRKNQLKRVCQVPAEGLSSDVWAWRKYGQKPIKGSPYPRGYYRCSSSKGCLARKQVERNRSDPGMFIVTYTAEHNHPAPTHRNSLAGSTRQKPLTPTTTPTTGDSSKPSSSLAKPTFSSSSPATSIEEETVPQSTKSESRELDLMEDDDEDDFGLSDVGISDDFFVGLEEFTSGESFSDQFPASFGLPLMANNAATAAGSI